MKLPSHKLAEGVPGAPGKKQPAHMPTSFVGTAVGCWGPSSLQTFSDPTVTKVT